MEDTIMTFAEQGNSRSSATSSPVFHASSPEEVVASPEGRNVPVQEAGADESSCKLKKLLLATLRICRMVTNNQVFQFGGNDADDQALESLVTDYATSLTAQASRLDLTGPILPMKVLRRIFTFAMISDCQPINDGDPSPVSPSIAVGALLVNHKVYHICRRALYSQNLFVFTSTGHLFNYIVRPLGLFVCKIRCGPRLMPALSDITLTIGNDYHDGYGITDVEAWIEALPKIHGRVRVKDLTLHFRHFCWNNKVTPEHLAALIGAKFRVSRQLTVFGTDYHWELDMGTFPRNLGMNATPFYRKLYPRVLDTFPQQPGQFECSYKPAKSDYELFGLNENFRWMEIDDAGLLYRKWCEENDIEIR